MESREAFLLRTMSACSLLVARGIAYDLAVGIKNLVILLSIVRAMFS